MKYLNTNRGPIAYAEHGRGQTVVLIHGSVTDLRIWQPLFPILARCHRTIAYSRRHHWPNPGPFDEYSFGRDVDDLSELLHKRSISAAHLVAHSAGGFVALEFMRRYSNKAISLTLFDANAVGLLTAPDATVVSSELRKWLGPVRTSLAAGNDKDALRRLLQPLAAKRKPPAWFMKMARENLPALKRQFSSKLPPPPISCDDLRKYPGSTLILQGESSPRTFKIVNEGLQRCAGDAQLKTIRSCGHIFQIDAPGEVLKQITQFIKR